MEKMSVQALISAATLSSFLFVPATPTFLTTETN